MGGIEKLLELRVGYRILIDPERFDVHGMVVETPRGILPGILHINPDIIEAFDLNPFNAELKISLWNFDHIRR